FISYIRQNFTIPTFSVRFISYIRQSFAIETFSVRFTSYIRQNSAISAFSLQIPSYIEQNSATLAFSFQFILYISNTPTSPCTTYTKNFTPNTMLPSKKYLLPTKETGNVKFHLFIYKHV